MSAPTLERCPVCRARLGPDEANCPRCDSNLSLLRATYTAAAHHQGLARHHLAEARCDEAVREALRAMRLVNQPSTQSTLLAALCIRRHET